MKIRDVAIDYLESHGLFRDQAVAAIGAPKTHLVNIWDDDIAGYPSAFHALVQLEAKRLALDWIDATMPKHFAQYVLDPKRMERELPSEATP
jgi:hypothetical protein